MMARGPFPKERTLAMPRPNLLFLMSDQQQAQTVDPASPCHTPHLDVLAERGVRFELCYTPNPICSPTRASMMTGVLPHTHGMDARPQHVQRPVRHVPLRPRRA